MESPQRYVVGLPEPAATTEEWREQHATAPRRRESDPYSVAASYYPDHQLLTTEPA